ncbi:MAG TPA: tetratricopeptide repeat protein, partial [Rhodocyclaceae bacterium]
MLLNFLRSVFAAQSRPDRFYDAAVALKQQGNECLARGELDAAMSCYSEAIRLEPDYAEALNNLGFVFKERGRFEEAEAVLSHAIQLNPALANAHLNLGVVALRRGDLEPAEASFERATRLAPENAEAYSLLANALHQQGKFDEASSALRKALELDPDDVEARWVLAMSSIPVVSSERRDADVVREEFLAELEALDRWFHPDRIGRGYLAVGSAQPFYLAYQEVSNKAVLERYGCLCKRLMDHWPDIDKFHASRLAPDGPIRIGIVTHLSNQSVWQPITRGWLQQLDRRRFDVCVFALDSGPISEMDIARASAREVVEGRQSLAEWVEAILAQRIEVLIFPEIGMTTMTAKLANLRLAPIQAVAWGHPETSGLPTIDYFLSGECFEDAAADENYTEKLVRLPNLGVFVSPSNLQSSAIDLKAIGLKPDSPILLCPGAPFKYAPEHDAVLIEIARRVPECQLVFFAEAGKKVLVGILKSRLQTAFQRAGLDFGKHVVFVPFLNRPAFFGLM